MNEALESYTLYSARNLLLGIVRIWAFLFSRVRPDHSPAMLWPPLRVRST